MDSYFSGGLVTKMSEFLHIVCCNSCMLLITLYLRLFSCWTYLFLGSFYIQILNELCLPEYWQLIFHLFWIHLQRPCSSSSFFSCFCLIFLSFHLNWGKVYYTFQMLFFCYCSTLSAFQCCRVAKWNCFFFCATISINVQIMTLRFHLVEVLSFLVQEVSQVTDILPLANGEEEITGDTF